MNGRASGWLPDVAAHARSRVESVTNLPPCYRLVLSPTAGENWLPYDRCSNMDSNESNRSKRRSLWSTEATVTRERFRAVAAKQGPPLAVSFAICLAIVGPWLRPGYIFATDFSGPRYFPLPTEATSFAPLQIVLALLARVLPGDVVGKVLILAIFFVAAFCAYQAAPTQSLTARAAASVVYTFNPFVYDRISYGQLTVLAGYALLPLVALALRRLLAHPDLRSALGLAAVFAAIGAVDIHFIVIATALSVCLVGAYVLLEGHAIAYIKRLGSRLLIAIGSFLVVGAYWILPFLLGTSLEARTLNQIGDADLRAFSTTTDDQLGLVANILGLHGFWAEQTHRYVPLKLFVPLWPLILLVLLAMCLVGAYAGVRAAKSSSPTGTRALVIGLGIAAALSLLLAMGVSESHTAALVGWMDAVMPQYRGMRDAGKWISVLALTYSQLVALGAAAMLTWSRARITTESVRETVIAAITAAAIAAPLYYGNGLLYGAHDQIRPSSYPVGWYAADRVLAADPNPGRTVFLPWHGYLALSFVRNTDRVVGNPAPLFFSVPVVASQDVEIPGVRPPTDDPDQALIPRLVAAGPQADWAAALATRGFKYLLVAREADWKSFTYFDETAGLQPVGDFTSILVYRNLLWHPS